MSVENNNNRQYVSDENHDDTVEDSEPKQLVDIFTHNSNIIITNCCKVNSTIYFGQLPPLELPDDIKDTGGILFKGEIEYGKQMAPMWIVTSYRLAKN